jgi:hypothetical protein
MHELTQLGHLRRRQQPCLAAWEIAQQHWSDAAAA